MILFDDDLMKNNQDFQKIAARYNRRLGDIPRLEYSYYLLAIMKKLVIGTPLSKADKLLTRLTLEHSLFHIMSKIRSSYLLEVGETLNLKQQEKILDILNSPLIKNEYEISINLLLTRLRREYT